MVFLSDYEKRSFKELGVKFLWQFALFVGCVLVVAGIFYGIEKNYSEDDFHYPDEAHTHTYTPDKLLKEEMEYLKNHTDVKSFSKKFNISMDNVLHFMKNVTEALNEYFESAHHNDNGDTTHMSDSIHGDLEGHYGSDHHGEDVEHSHPLGTEEHHPLGGPDYDNVRDRGMTYLEAYVLTLSIVFTVGWGHVVPIKSLGKLFSVLVALIGVPLTLIMIISGCHLFMRAIKRLLWKILQRSTRMNEDRLHDRINIGFKYFLILLFLTYMFVTSAIIARFEGYTYGDGVWYAFMAITTVGFGDVVEDRLFEYDRLAHKAGFAVFMMFWITVGFIHLGSVVLAFFYNYNRNIQLGNQFYKKNEQELVEDTDDFGGNVYTGGNTIYTGENDL